jgi:hypothetical protein
VELTLNLFWALGSVTLLGVVYRQVRRGKLQVSMASAITLAVMICFIVLPVISATDDLLDARQAGLPLSGQTWRMLSEGISAGVELPLLALYLVLLLSSLTVAQTLFQNRSSIRLLTGRLTLSQRLRPPPCAAS